MEYRRWSEPHTIVVLALSAGGAQRIHGQIIHQQLCIGKRVQNAVNNTPRVIAPVELKSLPYNNSH
jgi:hypothetical protein